MQTSLHPQTFVCHINQQIWMVSTHWHQLCWKAYQGTVSTIAIAVSLISSSTSWFMLRCIFKAGLVPSLSLALTLWRPQIPGPLVLLTWQVRMQTIPPKLLLRTPVTTITTTAATTATAVTTTAIPLPISSPSRKSSVPSSSTNLLPSRIICVVPWKFNLFQLSAGLSTP